MIGDRVRILTQEIGSTEIDIIGSGYNIQVLPAAWLALVSGLLNLGLEVEEPLPVPPAFLQDTVADETERVLQRLQGILKDYWKCFS